MIFRVFKGNTKETPKVFAKIYKIAKITKSPARWISDIQKALCAVVRAKMGTVSKTAGTGPYTGHLLSLLPPATHDACLTTS